MGLIFFIMAVCFGQWIDRAVYISFSLSSLVVSPISHAHVGASGHTVSLLTVTVVLVLECSTGGEGD